MTLQYRVMYFWLGFIYLAPLWGEARQMWCFWRQMWSGACFPSVEPLQCLAGCQPGFASGGMEEAPVYSLCVCGCVRLILWCVPAVCTSVSEVCVVLSQTLVTLITDSTFTPSSSDISRFSNVTTHTHMYTHSSAFLASMRAAEERL